MRNRFNKKLIIGFILIILGLFLVVFINNPLGWSLFKNSNFNKSNTEQWSNDFKIIDIISSQDDMVQKCFSYKSQSEQPKPLVISLHTWSGDYSQKDPLANLCKAKDLNYLHPNFRGSNNTKEACCSDLVISDIDDAITFALNNFNVDSTKIYIIGFSGGGYTTLCTYLKSKHKIAAFSAWASITDLNAWYNQSLERENDYNKDILNCTESKTILNIKAAKQRSPLYWETTKQKLNTQRLSIFAGVRDGIEGSVPITHSINFYNKLLTDLKVKDSTKFVTQLEREHLRDTKISKNNLGKIGNRSVLLKKTFNDLSLTIFDGHHEILSAYALDNLLEIE
jgi:esterase/lipase